MTHALITGASSGLGRAISFELAKRGYHLVLVARNQHALAKVKHDIETLYNINVTCYCVDLTKADEVTDFLSSVTEEISVVVNNAGIGYLGTFESLTKAQHEQILQVNIMALQQITHHYLTQFKAKNDGYILNIASTAAFSSGPLMSTYYASKAYVLSLGEAIAEELSQSNSNVVISTCCPGPIDTNFHARANLNATRHMPCATTVAKQAVEHLFAHKPLVIPGWDNQLLVFFTRFLPRKLVRYIVYKNQVAKIK